MAQGQTGAPTQEGSAKQEEKQTNCLACNKPLKKVRIYYRDGKFYCTKRCWKDFLEKAKTGAK
jgi:hypothetical protein